MAAKNRLARSLLVELTIAVSLSLLMPLLLGLGLDALLGRGPVMFFIGGSAGIVIGTIVVVRIVLRRLRALTEPMTGTANPQEFSFGEEDRA